MCPALIPPGQIGSRITYPRKWANQPGGERARGRKSQGANKPGGKPAKGRKSQTPLLIICCLYRDGLPVRRRSVTHPSNNHLIVT